MSLMDKYVKSSETYCRIKNCQWSGNCTNILKHFEIRHPLQIRIVNEKSYLQLTFEDLRRKSPLLLCAGKELYWFVQNEHEQKDGYFSRGIFTIGTSQPINYHIKLGMFSTKIVQMWGPFQSHDEKSQSYDFVMQANYMENLTKIMTSNVTIFFGEFEDAADERKAVQNSSNIKSRQQFDCTSCEKPIIKSLFCCTKYHVLCEPCFEIVLISKCPKCESTVNAAAGKS